MFRSMRREAAVSARWSLQAVVLAIALVMIGVPGAAQDINPSGYITGIGWVALGPFQTPFGCSGNDADILTNHIPPGRIFCEYPEEGDELAEFDDAAAAADGIVYVGPTTGPNGRPEWRLFDDGSATDAQLDFDADFNPGQDDNDLAIFVATYVEYEGDPIEIFICANSDDGRQVWWDDQLVLNNNRACQAPGNPDADACDELVPVLVTEGVHRIMFGVWERGGGWAGSLGLRTAGGVKIDDFNALGFFFLGTDPGGIVPPPCRDPALRELSTPSDPSSCPPTGGGPVNVTISQPLGGLPGGDAVSVVETVNGPFGAADVTAAGASVSDVFPSGLTRFGFIDSWLLLGPFNQGGGANPGEDAMRLDYLTDGAGVDELTVEPVAGDSVNTDFGGAAASTGLAVSGTINPGGVPTWAAWSDPDDTINFNDYYGGDVDNIMMYAVTYIDLPQAIDANLCAGSDDAIQVLIDGVEVHINNAARGWGNANQCQDSVPIVGGLDTGQHMILVKIFEGGGGHGFRLRIEDAFTGEAPEGMTVCLDPDADPCPWAPSGVEISWDATRQQLADGLSYSIGIDSGTIQFRGQVDSGQTAGDAVFTVIPDANDYGAVIPGIEHAHDIGQNCTGTEVSSPVPGVLRITGAGADIWNNADQFVYAYREVTGDFSATVRIASRALGNNDWAKHGIMARETCSPGSRYSYVCDQNNASLTMATGSCFQWRAAQDAAAAWSGSSVLGAGHADVLRLDRVGSEFVGYALDEFGDLAGLPGEWIELGRLDWALQGGVPPETIQLGLAVTSHDGCNLVTVEFEDWDVIEGTPASPPRNLVCSGTGAGIDLVWELPSEDGGPIDIHVNGVEVAADLPADTISYSIPSAELEDGVNTIVVRNDVGTVTCGFFQGDELYINCGGERLDDLLGTGVGDGRVWEEDTLENPSPFLASANANTADFAAGLAPPPEWAPTNTVLVENRSVEGPDRPDFVDDPVGSRLFAKERWEDGDVRYRIPLPQGSYAVTLLFAEGCCSGGCEDIADPQNSLGDCRVVDVYINDELVEDQFSQHVEAQRALADLGLGNQLPNEDWGIPIAKGPYYLCDTNVVDITIDDLGGGGNPQNASIKGIAITPVEAPDACGPGGVTFVRGDANSDNSINLTDGIVVLNFLFLGQAPPKCMDAADVDDNGGERPSLTDAIRIFNWLFTGGPPPAAPSPSAANYQPGDCGVDPPGGPADTMGCEEPSGKCSP